MEVQCCSEASYGWWLNGEHEGRGARLQVQRAQEAQRCRLSLSPWTLGCPVASLSPTRLVRDSSFPGKTSHKWVERGCVEGGTGHVTAALHPTSGSGGVKLGLKHSARLLCLSPRPNSGTGCAPHHVILECCLGTSLLCYLRPLYSWGEAQAGSLQSNIKLSGKLRFSSVLWRSSVACLESHLCCQFWLLTLPCVFLLLPCFHHASLFTLCRYRYKKECSSPQ